MRRTIDVLLGESPVHVGSLYYDVQGARESASFEYSAEWLGSRDAFAIAPDLRLITGPQFHKRTGEGSAFHDAIADTEPDGWAKNVILRDHAKRRQQAKRSGQPTAPAALNSLDFLLAVDDESRVGALRFRNEDGVFCRPCDEHHRTTPPLIELGALASASRAVELNAETLADLAYFVDALRVHGAAVQQDIEELFRRIAFSILITNVDDHLHNHGFLHVQKGQWRLAPAFDLNPFPDRVRELKTWISEETGPEASVEALMSVAPYFRLGERRAKLLIGEVEAAVANWRQVGRSLEMSEQELDDFAEAFEHPERSVAAKLSR